MTTTPSSHADHRARVAYIDRKLALEAHWLDALGLDDELEAQEAWSQDKRDPVTLMRWCERWLSPQQRAQLNDAVRAARRRRRHHRGDNDPPVSVTLSRPAWFILKDLAQEEGLTLSDWLIAHHRQDWLDSLSRAQPQPSTAHHPLTTDTKEKPQC